jgi:hypothetical protein
MLVWRTCYSAVRTGWTIEDVTAMLDTFEAAKMLFRWKVDGKTYGFFIGMQKEGRLPKPSDREKSAKQWQHGMMPEKELASFLEVPVKKVRETYRELLATISRPTRDKSAKKSPTGNGIGVGSGSGLGAGSGEGNGKGIGHGNGAVSPPTQSVNTLPPANTSLPQHDNTNTTTPNTPPAYGPEEFDDDEFEEKPPVAAEWLSNLTPQGFAELFRLLMYDNPTAVDTPKGWAGMWAKDFKTILDGDCNPTYLLDIVVISQLEKNKQFYIRPAKLVERFPLLQTMLGESRKKISPLRVEFRKKVKKLEEEHGWPRS